MNFMYTVHYLAMLAGGSIDGDKKPLDPSEQWGVTLAGLGIVIAGLLLLVLVIFLFGKLFDAIGAAQRAKEAAKVAEKTPKPTPAPVKETPAPAPAPAIVIPEEDEDEVIAVISAVIAMMSEADGTAYRVKSVRPSAGLSGRAAWAMDGRRNNVSPF